MMYKYFHMDDYSTDEDESVSMHDCKATRMSLNGGTLSFCFPDGFWVVRNGSDGRNLFYTGESQVDFPLLYSADAAITIYVFTEENEKIIREEHTAKDFINLINEKESSLEFLYSYIGCQTFKFECWLWFDEEPYHRECEITVSAEKVIYQWNDMYEEED